MYKRLSQLSFVIGLFFTLIAIILLVGYAVSSLLQSALNLYTGLGFLVFGFVMIFFVKEKHEDTPPEHN